MGKATLKRGKEQKDTLPLRVSYTAIAIYLITKSAPPETSSSNSLDRKHDQYKRLEAG